MVTSTSCNDRTTHHTMLRANEQGQNAMTAVKTFLFLFFDTEVELAPCRGGNKPVPQSARSSYLEHADYMACSGIGEQKARSKKHDIKHGAS